MTKLPAARKMDVQVIFSPSAVTDFYKDYPQRKAITGLRETREYIYPAVEELQKSGEKKQLDHTRYNKKYFEGTIYEARNAAGTTYKGYTPFPLVNVWKGFVKKQMYGPGKIMI